MFKKLSAIVFALTMFSSISLEAMAADVCQEIFIQSRGVNNKRTIEFTPRVIHLNTGDTLHLKINNAISNDTRFFVSSLNLDQEVPKFKDAQINICMANPNNEIMQFQIQDISGKPITGYFVIDDYQTPDAGVTSRTLDTSHLASIINYSKDYCYEAKREPDYSRQNPVRGYW